MVTDAPLTTARGGSPRVLVVDDTEALRLLIRVNLELEGFEVSEAVDGQDALETLRSTADEDLPDVVTFDVVMPRLDGFAAAAAVRADPRTRDLPLVMVTTQADAEDRARAADLGVAAYVTKPFDPAALTAAVRSALEQHSAG